MNSIQLIVLLLQALQVFCSIENLRSLTDCGWTPFYPKPQIVANYSIAPDEFSWLARLEYGYRGYGNCGGSVISSLYVLTAAHCVTGKQVDKYGGVKGVRLGNFTQEPYCDYGTSNCSSYLRFGIANIIVHENYHKDSNLTLRNDIALLRLDSPILFGPHMKPVCLPFNTKELIVNTQLIVAGWGQTTDFNDSTGKRAVGVPLLDKGDCEYQDESLICAAQLAKTVNESRTTCEGDSGGPLMYAFNPRQMVIEGIVSFIPSSCANPSLPTHYTRVRHYLNWIEKNVCTGSDCTSVTETKFPTDCGNTPMYPRGQTDNGNIVRPDEYSWVARLVFGNTLLCVGSVINSRYVLAAAQCVSGDWITLTGRLTGVRLGDYDENGHICDYGTENCTHYQEFGIDKIIPHSGYNSKYSTIVNNIALIRLNRSIQFGPKMTPICLPFGSNTIPEPPVDSSLTVTDWIYLEDKKLFAKRDAIIALWETEKCKAKWPVDGTQICTEDLCIGGSGSPLMYYQLTRRRMVLEGIWSHDSDDCTDIRSPLVYTRVRSYHDWLDQNIEM